MRGASGVGGRASAAAPNSRASPPPAARRVGLAWSCWFLLHYLQVTLPASQPAGWSSRPRPSPPHTTPRPPPSPPPPTPHTHAQPYVEVSPLFIGLYPLVGMGSLAAFVPFLTFLSFYDEFSRLHPLWPPHYAYLAARVGEALQRGNMKARGRGCCVCRVRRVRVCACK